MLVKIWWRIVIFAFGASREEIWLIRASKAVSLRPFHHLSPPHPISIAHWSLYQSETFHTIPHHSVLSCPIIVLLSWLPAFHCHNPCPWWQEMSQSSPHSSQSLLIDQEPAIGCTGLLVGDILPLVGLLVVCQDFTNSYTHSPSWHITFDSSPFISLSFPPHLVSQFPSVQPSPFFGHEHAI